jgi:ferredoxin
MLKGYEKVLNVGCGTCVAVCLAGGEKEVDVLNAELDMAMKLDEKKIELGKITIERQCDIEYLEKLDDLVPEYDAILSMACGVGVQFLAERFPDKPVYPAVDTSGLAANRAVGWYEEKCRSCESCMLGWTGAICPMTMCAKSLQNGPCGGTNDGKCEISQDQDCAWFKIYERLAGQDRLDCIKEYKPAGEWKDQVPRTLIQPGYKKSE